MIIGDPIEITYHDLNAVMIRRQRIFLNRSYSCPAWFQSVPLTNRIIIGAERALKRIKAETFTGDKK